MSITEAKRSILVCGALSDEYFSPSHWICKFGKCQVSDRADSDLAEIERVARY